MKEIEIAFIGGSGLYKIPNLKKFKMALCHVRIWRTFIENNGWSFKREEIAFLPRTRS